MTIGKPFSGVAVARIAFVMAMIAFTSPAFSRPCNAVYGCVVRAEFCTVEVIDSGVFTIALATPDLLRGGAIVTIGPYNGHLYGLTAATPSVIFNSSGNFTRSVVYSAGALTTFVNQKASGAGSSATIQYSDLDLTIPGQSAGMTYEQITPLLSTQGMTITTAQFNLVTSWNAGPVSATVTFSQPQLRVRAM